MTTQRQLKPSAYVKRFAETVAEAAQGFPIADVGCGSGRNAIFVAELGCNVICIDKNLSPLRNQELVSSIQKRLTLLFLDVLKAPWPFTPGTLGGVILVDFLPWPLLPQLADCLIPNGSLLLETVSGRGENFRELPKAGQLEATFRPGFMIENYREKYVKPRSSGAVTVKMLARRR
jgi:SAM-dependent methyltransferase